MKLRGMVVVCLVACGGGGGGGGGGDDAPVIDAPIDAPVGKSMIGPAGGAVASMDGVATLTVPAGALTADTEITIDALPQAMWPASITPANPIGAVYSIGPEGTVFAVPATLTWQFTTAPTGSKDASNRPKVLFGYSRSASDVFEDDLETRSRHAGAALTVTSRIAHLSEHFLTTKNLGSSGNVFIDVGSVVAELRGGRHAVGLEWTAQKIEIHPADLNDVELWFIPEPDAPVVKVPQAEWMTPTTPGINDGLVVYTVLRVGTPYVPAPLPKFKCESVGVGKVVLGVVANIQTLRNTRGFTRGVVIFEEEVDCYDRVQKTEYTVEAGILGQTRIAPLAVPATAMINLADQQGAYGYQVCLLPGQTIRVCVGASMPTAVNYFPQFPPGFTFVDGVAGSGCVTITNLDANDPNCVLVKTDGGGSPNNVTVTTTIP